MARYRYTGSTPVIVPDLHRYIDHPIQPDEEFEADVEINNAYFDLIPAVAPAEPQESEEA